MANWKNFKQTISTDDTDESGQDAVFPCEGHVAPIPEAVVLAKSMAEPTRKKGTARTPTANSAALICLRIVKSDPRFIFSFRPAHADKIAKLY